MYTASAKMITTESLPFLRLRNQKQERKSGIMELKAICSEPKGFFRFLEGKKIVRFAICDDDKSIMDEIRPIINNFANARRFEALTDCYYSGEDLVLSETAYDLVILDYQMGQLNGLDAARILREKNCTCAIIFLTNHPHFVFDAFTVKAHRFLKKPLIPEHLIEALDSYFKMYGFDYPLLLQSKYETVCVETKDIVFLEAVNKCCNIHLQHKCIPCSKTMAVISNRLPRNHFYKVNRAFIINFNYIDSYDNDSIFFKNGESVHISRNYLTAFKTAYRAYTDSRRPQYTKG